jgi:hypothetical protein
MELIKYRSLIPEPAEIPDQLGIIDQTHEFGTYRGVQFLMRGWFQEYLGKCFTYYIYIPLNCLPFAEDGSISEEAEDWDFHGGISWTKFYPEDNYAEIGCDYQHYGDKNINKDFNHIRSDVYNTIDEFLKWLMKKHQKSLEK